MAFVDLLSVFQIVLSTIIVSIGVWTWNGKSRSLKTDSLLLLHLSIGFWLFINALELKSVDLQVKYFWGRLQYLPLVLLPIEWFYFTCGYAQSSYRLKRGWFALIVSIGFLLVTFVLTNGLHQLFWVDMPPKIVGGMTYLESRYGIGFFGYVIFMFSLIFSGVYQIIKTIRLAGTIKSWQSSVLIMSIIAVFSSILLDVLDLSFFPEPELSSIILAFIIPIVGYTLDKLQYADIMPAAYKRVFDNLEDAVVVVSPNYTIIDMNRQARTLAGETSSGKAGTLNEVFPFLPIFDNETADVEPSVLTINHDDHTVILEILRVPITDQRAEIHSYNIVMRNITEQHLRERTLLRRNEELEVLNQISSYASSSSDFKDLLAFAAKLACVTLKSSGAYIMQVALENDCLTVQGKFANPNSTNLSKNTTDIGQSFVISEISPELLDWLADAANHDLTQCISIAGSQILNKLHIRSSLSAPIRIRSKLYGLIVIIESEKARSFESDEIQLLQSIANQLGSAIENAQLYGELHREVNDRMLIEDQLRSSLREKDTLLKEVHHRVKNNLQVISSLLRLQLSTATDPQINELVRDSQSRIQSMALVHELLYQSDNLATIDLGEYLQFLAHSLMASFQSEFQQIHIRTDCVSVDVTIETAITCGLLLNELVSNAIKHAFPNDNSGSIEVRLETNGETDLRLIVQDDGVGFSRSQSPKQGNSLGLKLIDSFVNQLDGELQVNNDSGTRYEIRITLN